jgi:hypothetical protein
MARRQPEPTANPARGAALVVVAVVIGLLLLREGLDTSEAITTNGGNGNETSDGGDTSDGTDATDEGSGDTTTTTVAVRPPAEVPTIVLNGTSIGGVAGSYSESLASLGYNLTNPDGANDESDTDVAATAVYFAPGFEAEAVAVAFSIGAPNTAVAPMPATPPGPIAGASVVVVIGTDLASVTPTTAATSTTAAT